jgi:hypothetical protein
MELIASLILGINILAAIGVFWLRPTSRDLMANGTVRLEFISVPGISLPHAHAYLRGNEVLVTGRLRRELTAPGPSTGTLEISLVSPDGMVLERTTASYALSSTAQRGGGGFSVRFHSLPPYGSVIRIKCTPVHDQGATRVPAPHA